MTLQTALEKFAAYQQAAHAYSHAIGVLYYDGVTGAPRGGAPERGDTLAFLSGEMYRLTTAPETAEIVETILTHAAEVTPGQARSAYLLRKELTELRAIPAEEYTAYKKLESDSSDVWHTAKEQNNWTLWEPYLEKIVAAQRRFAALCAPDKDPYDYCLDKFEEGLTMQRCDEFFAVLRQRIVPLLEKVKAAAPPDTDFIHVSVSEPAQDKLCRRLMELIGMNPLYSSLATTEHPFTTNFSKHDVRITTHYFEEDFASGMFSVIHEGGHALYELNTADDLRSVGLDTGCSMAIHESQSRFFENILGRSRAFCECVFPMLCEYVPGLENHTAEELYRAVNRAEPSLVRTEADELTYCLHIMVRYKIEKAMMHGEVEVKDLPALWNRLYKEYLGVDVPDDRRGILQDSHWSDGGIGYFPSYALGSAYGAQLLRRMKRDVAVDECVRAGDFRSVSVWLTEKIWRFGQLLTPAEVLSNALGESFDPTVFCDYLEEKYTELYNLEK